MSTHTPVTASSSIWRAVKHYAYGLFAKSWNGGIAAIYAFIGQAVGHGLDPDAFDMPGWKTLAYTFGVAFSIQALGYFKDHPLPDKLPESSPPFPTTTKIEDGKITTTPAGPADVQPPKPLG